MTNTDRTTAALSGVVLGSTAGALISGDGATHPAESAAAKVDGGELVGRVLQARGVKYLFAVNGGHTWPILATCANTA